MESDSNGSFVELSLERVKVYPRVFSFYFFSGNKEFLYRVFFWEVMKKVNPLSGELLKGQKCFKREEEYSDG